MQFHLRTHEHWADWAEVWRATVVQLIAPIVYLWSAVRSTILTQHPARIAATRLLLSVTYEIAAGTPCGFDRGR